MIVSTLSKNAQLMRGQSYWQVKLTTGRTFSELDEPVKFEPDPVTGRMVARKRKIEWAEDIVASGDTAHIKEIHLITPQGDAYLSIVEPYSAIQFKRGTMMILGAGQRIANAHIIGRVDNLETGDCTATIWDVQEQHLYVDHQTNVKTFAAWRPGVAAVGLLALDAIGLRLK